MKNNDQTVLKISETALFAALCFVAFRFLKIVLPGGGVLHVGNAFCVLCALLLGGVYGGLAGSVGMTIADLLDPRYITSAPKTFLLKLCIGLIVGLVAHRMARLSQEHERKYLVRWTILASACGLGFNVICDPLVGYFYKRYVLGMPVQLAESMAKIAAASTFINAVVSLILVTVTYLALRPVLKRSGLFLIIK